MTPWAYLWMVWELWRARKRHEYRLNVEREIRQLKERNQ